jgi:hypothetical protein
VAQQWHAWPEHGGGAAKCEEAETAPSKAGSWAEHEECGQPKNCHKNGEFGDVKKHGFATLKYINDNIYIYVRPQTHWMHRKSM